MWERNPKEEWLVTVTDMDTAMDTAMAMEVEVVEVATTTPVCRWLAGRRTLPDSCPWARCDRTRELTIAATIPSAWEVDTTFTTGIEKTEKSKTKTKTTTNYIKQKKKERRKLHARERDDRERLVNEVEADDRDGGEFTWNKESS